MTVEFTGRTQGEHGTNEREEEQDVGGSRLSRLGEKVELSHCRSERVSE